MFSGLTDDAENVIYGNNNNRETVIGFQVVGIAAAVPEPSTWALMFGGLALLVGVQQFRRRCD
jgi:hypothetical protein